MGSVVKKLLAVYRLQFDPTERPRFLRTRSGAHHSSYASPAHFLGGHPPLLTFAVVFSQQNAYNRGNNSEVKTVDVYHAIKMLQIEHQPLNHSQVVIIDGNGKPQSQLSDLLFDCMSKIDLFTDLSTTDTSSDVIDDLHLLTPLPNDVLNEYQKILDQPISGINIASHKNLVELVYEPLV